jgi:hypothetical protein
MLSMDGLAITSVYWVWQEYSINLCMSTPRYYRQLNKYIYIYIYIYIDIHRYFIWISMLRYLGTDQPQQSSWKSSVTLLSPESSVKWHFFASSALNRRSNFWRSSHLTDAELKVQRLFINLTFHQHATWLSLQMCCFINLLRKVTLHLPGMDNSQNN